MAILKAPCLSLQASGSVGSSVAYARQQHRHIAKSVAVPTGAPSSAQLSQRAAVSAAASYWSTVKSSPALMQAWHDLRVASGSRLTDYHYVMKWALSVAGSVDSDTIFVAQAFDPAGVFFWSYSFTTGEPVTDTDPYSIYVGSSILGLSFLETVVPEGPGFPSGILSLDPGSYYFQVKDANGVPRMPPTLITVTPYEANTASVINPDVADFNGVLQYVFYSPHYIRFELPLVCLWSSFSPYPWNHSWVSARFRLETETLFGPGEVLGSTAFYPDTDGDRRCYVRMNP